MTLENFIVFEGIDGSGTSTQISLLKNQIGTEKFLFTAEPTSAPTGKFLRQMLKGDFPLTPETAAYLFAADRNEHVNGEFLYEGQTLVTGIKKACSLGYTVVSDRYLFSSLAYQSVQGEKEVPRRLNSGFPLPSLVFFFEIEPKIALNRINNRETKEIYEKEAFLEQTVSEYKRIFSEYQKSENKLKIIYIDATQSAEEIQKIIWQEIKNQPIKN